MLKFLTPFLSSRVCVHLAFKGNLCIGQMILIAAAALQEFLLVMLANDNRLIDRELLYTLLLNTQCRWASYSTWNCHWPAHPKWRLVMVMLNSNGSLPQVEPGDLTSNVTLVSRSSTLTGCPLFARLRPYSTKSWLEPPFSKIRSWRHGFHF